MRRLILVSLLLALWIFLIAGCNIINKLINPPSEKPLPVSGSKIAFYLSGSYEIYVMNVDGSDRHRIAFDGQDPDWSPDGTKIAFGRWPKLMVMDADGGNLREIPIPKGILANYPSWSPDGRKIAFRCYLEGQSEICVVNIDGSGFQKLTNLSYAGYPNWSPDGRKIVFSSGGSTIATPGKIWVMNADGSDQRILTSGVHCCAKPAWAPNGTRIAFEGWMAGGGLWVIDADGGNLRQLTDFGAHPTWSPDGKQIAFEAQKYKGFDTSQTDIYIMKADGTDLRNITETIDVSEYGPDWSPAFP